MAGRALAAVAFGLVAAWLVLVSAGQRIEWLAEIPGPATPSELRAELMTGLGTAARAGDEAALPANALISLARAAPLDAAPFLVAGAVADERGDEARADRLYAAALARDPRSAATHYMLAQRRLAEGRVAAGLAHMAVLGRIAPGAAEQFGPALVAFAREPHSERALKPFLDREPAFRGPLLSALASDPAMAPRVLQLAGPLDRSSPPPAWVTTLADTLLADGQGERAARSWAALVGAPVPGMALVEDGRFAQPRLVPPFGWSLPGSDVGVAERGEGGLEVAAYGRGEGVLARQSLRLRPGKFTLSSTASGDVRLLQWRITCGDKKARPLAVAMPGATAAFQVPGDCPTQALELWASAGEVGGGEALIRAVAVESVR